MEENRLVERSKQGDEEAFGVLVKKYKTKVFNLAYSFSRNRETADDLAQEVFIKVYYALEKFKFKSGFGTWLYRIAINHFKDYMRKHGKAQHISFDALGREPSLADEDTKKKKGPKKEPTEKSSCIRRCNPFPKNTSSF